MKCIINFISFDDYIINDYKRNKFSWLIDTNFEYCYRLELQKLLMSLVHEFEKIRREPETVQYMKIF